MILRRLSQALFLAWFLLLLCPAGYRLPLAVRIFLEADPLLAVMNALAAHSLYRGLLWNLAVLIPTLFLGRFYCGWICPLGTLHHPASSIRSEKKTGRRRIASNRHQQWQGLKYYALFPALAAALAGSAWGGLLDPISQAVRSFALSMLPALTYALGQATRLFRGGRRIFARASCWR